MNLAEVHKVHMLGIGGIGMSALARFLQLQGKRVSGYDKTATPLTIDLQRDDIQVNYQPDSSLLEGADLLIYTPAVPNNQVEFEAARRMGIPIMKRAEVLGMISRAFNTVAVGGTHGKTSTTGLITYLLRSAGVDCTGFIGGMVRNFDSNFISGKGDWFVVEADEFDRSFLQLSPDISVITSMDPDHLEIYGDHDHVKAAFRDFAFRLKSGGKLFLNDKLRSNFNELPPKTETYGIERGDRRAVNFVQKGISSHFDYESEGISLKNLVLNIPGRYNVENAVAAISVALEMGVSGDQIRAALPGFLGIRRRFDIQHNGADVVYIDDYAHHPEEIRALLEAVRELLPHRKIIAIFQPHLFSRTFDFHEGFASALSLADSVILLDIYPAREEPMEGVSSRLIYDLLKTSEKVLTGLNELKHVLEAQKSHHCVVLTIGAGDIDTKIKETKELVAAWQ